MLLKARLFNEDIWIFSSKISVESIFDWYKENKNKSDRIFKI